MCRKSIAQNITIGTKMIEGALGSKSIGENQSHETANFHIKKIM